MSTYRNKIFSVVCALLMIVMVFQNVSAGEVEDNVVDIDVFIDYLHIQHKVWRTETNGSYQLFYTNNKAQNNTGVGISGLIVINTTDNVRYPQVVVDPTSDFCYILWVTGEPGSEEFWYCGSIDYINWTTAQLGGNKPVIKGNPTLDMFALNYTLFLSWKQGGATTIVPDLDMDMIPDRFDSNPFMYDVQGNDPFKADVIVLNHILGVSVAIDYEEECSEEPIISYAELPLIIPGGASGYYIDVNIESNVSFVAIIKINYAHIQLSSSIVEKYLCLYYWNDAQWMILADRTLNEDTGSETNYNYVWGKTSHFSTYTFADALSNDCDIDGLNDGEEMNLDKAPFVPINHMSDKLSHKSLTFGDYERAHIIEFNIPDYLATMEFVVDAKFVINGTSETSDGINITIDIGNDGAIEWIFRGDTEFNTTTPSFVMAFNEYLSSHNDDDDGLEDSEISVPVLFLSNEKGEMGIAYISILVGTYDSDPTKSDTDKDGINDGEEFNIVMAKPSKISSLEYNGISSNQVIIPLSENGSQSFFSLSRDNNFPSVYPQIAYGDDLHAVWQEDQLPYQNIMYSISTDHGATWSIPKCIFSLDTRIFSMIHSESLDIASDGKSLGIVFTTSVIGQSEPLYYFSLDGGEKWDYRGGLSGNTGYAAIDWQGDTAYIVYRECPHTYPGEYVFKGIAFKTYENGSFGDPIELFETDGPYGIPKIAVDGGDIHIVFCAPDIPDPGLFDKAIYLHGSISSGIFLDPIELTTYTVDGIPYSRQSFSLDAQCGVVYYSWQNYDNTQEKYDILYTLSSDHGMTWSTGAQASFGTSNSLNPSVILDSDSNAYIVWQDDRTGIENIRYSHIDEYGHFLVRDFNLTEESSPCINPCISIDENDKLYVLWEDYRGTASEIYTKSDGIKLFANIPVNINSLEYIGDLSMNMRLKKTSLNFENDANGFILESDGERSEIDWDPTNKNIGFYFDSTDDEVEYYARPLGYDLTKNSPSWELNASFAITDYTINTKATPFILSGTTYIQNEVTNTIQLYFETVDHGSQKYTRIGALYTDNKGINRIALQLEDCIPTMDYKLTIKYENKKLTLSIYNPNKVLLASNYYILSSYDIDDFLFNQIGVQSLNDGPNWMEGWVEGYIDNINVIFTNAPLLIDAGNDGDSWPVDDFGVPIAEIASEINQYLSTHDDMDDGNLDGHCRVPIVIKSNWSGELIISDIRMSVNILCTNPAMSDTDLDGLGDGEEYNKGARHGGIISSFMCEETAKRDITFQFYDGNQYTPCINIPTTPDSMEFISSATMDISWTPETIVVSDTGSQSYNPLVIHDSTTNEIHTYWQDSSIFYYRLFDGESWGETTPITQPFESSFNNLKYSIDTENRVHVVFEYRAPGSPGSDIDIAYMDGDISGWSPIMIVNEGSVKQAGNPSLVIDSNDNVHVVWDDRGDILNSQDDYDIFYRACIDNIWTDIQLVSDSSTDRSINPSIAVDSEDRLYIAWQDRTPIGSNTKEKIFCRYLDEGGWSSIKYPYLNAVAYSKPYLTVDYLDKVHIMWNTVGGMAYTIYSNDSWGSFELISMADAETANLIIDSQNNTHLVWRSNVNYSDAGTDGDVLYICKRGDSWTNTELISTYSNELSTSPTIVVPANTDEDMILIFYNEFSTSSDIVYKKFKGLNRIPGKIILDVGSDGDEQWAPGYSLRPIETTIDFSAELNEYLLSNPVGENDLVSVPLYFYTGDYGTLTISNLKVVYDVIVTNPIYMYTDGDVLSDKEEFFGQMLTRDLNGDGDTKDACELYLARSNPALIDSDWDGLYDDIEAGLFTDPSVIDTDYDSLSDWEEFYCGVDKFSTNATDVDTDGDHFHDFPDAFPTDPTEWLDTDFDGLGNNYDDNDDDNDGVTDIYDPFRLNPSGSVDTDSDGKPDIVLPSPWWFTGTILIEDLNDDNDAAPDYVTGWLRDADNDNDGLYDIGEYDEFPLDKTEWIDTDLDGIGNNDDDNDDGDGIPDFGEDGAPGTLGYDDDHDGYIDNGEDRDKDGDIDWSPESYPPSDHSWDDPNPYDSNIGLNTDGDYVDGVAYDDNVDDDDDTPCQDITLGDNVKDINDAFPKNPTGTTDTDKDGLPDFVLSFPFPFWFEILGGTILIPDLDDDGDGVLDVHDKFPLNPNEWADTDSDGIGDNTDADDDADGAIDSVDAFPLNPTGKIDTDKDGKPDNLLIALWWSGPILTEDIDDDGDGLLDTVETNTGVYFSPSNTGTNSLSVDTDGDKLTDYEEVVGRVIHMEINNLPGADITYTVSSNPTKTNSDKDSLDDYWENIYGTDPTYEDTDNDGIMDGDELIDEFGGGWFVPGDSDGDGTPNGPTDWDSNGNARSDGLENMVKGFPSPNAPDFVGTDDYDGDGLTNAQELTIDYNTNLAGIQGTSYIIPDSDNDGFWDGVDYGMGTSYILPVKTKQNSGSFTFIDYIIKVVDSKLVQYGEGYLAPPTAMGNGYKGTHPLNNDQDGDRFKDGEDVDPLTDLKVTVEIKEVLQINPYLDGRLTNFADFQIFVKCMDARFFNINWYCSHISKSQVFSNNPNPRDLNLEYEFDVNDGAESIDFEIAVFDYDGDGSNYPDLVDIDGKNIEFGTEQNSIINIEYNLKGRYSYQKFDPWGGDDRITDSDGYGHTSGPDALLWFYISQNDGDQDGLTYAQETQYYHTYPNIKTCTDMDNDGISNDDEYLLKSNPSLEDSDIDGLNDFEESQLDTSATHWGVDIPLPYRVVNVFPDSDPDGGRLETEVKSITFDEIELMDYEVISPDDVEPTNIIKFPAIGCPALVAFDEGGTFDVFMDTSSTSWAGKIVPVTGGVFSYILSFSSYDLDINSGYRKAIAKVPASAPEGLYDLVITLWGTDYTVPHAVQVQNSHTGTFKFVQITDIHIGEGYGDDGNIEDFLAIIRRLNLVEKPDFVIITGDLTQNGDETETQYFKACMLNCETPIFTTPGNHDNYYDVGDKFTDYRKWINPSVLSSGEDTEYCDDYSFDYGDFHFISYNSGDSSNNPLSMTILEGLTPTQLAWMQADAASTAKAHVIIFTHAPSVPNGDRNDLGDHSHTDKWEWDPTLGFVKFDSDLEFVEWLNSEAGCKVEAVFAGHTHQDHIWYGVSTNEIEMPEEYPNPRNFRSLLFSGAETPYYIETNTTCKNYP